MSITIDFLAGNRGGIGGWGEGLEVWGTWTWIQAQMCFFLFSEFQKKVLTKLVDIRLEVRRLGRSEPPLLSAHIKQLETMEEERLKDRQTFESLVWFASDTCSVLFINIIWVYVSKNVIAYCSHNQVKLPAYRDATVAESFFMKITFFWVYTMWSKSNLYKCQFVCCNPFCSYSYCAWITQ